MGRTPCCEKNGLKKGPWTPEEDQKLINYIERHGHGSWRALPKRAELLRCGKSCRLRWTNYLRPDIKRGKFSFEEEHRIIELHAIIGNKWSTIAASLPGRTDNEIKNYWNTHLKKRLLQMGIDPVTHRPRIDLFDFSNMTQFFGPATLSHMSAHWENARFEAVTREYLRLAACRSAAMIADQQNGTQADMLMRALRSQLGADAFCRPDINAHVTAPQPNNWGQNPEIGLDYMNALPEILEQLHARAQMSRSCSANMQTTQNSFSDQRPALQTWLDAHAREANSH